MKIILATYVDHFAVEVRNSEDFMLHAYTFTTKNEAYAFISGFNCAKTVINGLVQSLPLNHETRDNKPSKQPETIGQQLSKQWVGRA
jgi:hypothetical protein